MIRAADILSKIRNHKKVKKTKTHHDGSVKWIDEILEVLDIADKRYLFDKLKEEIE